MAAAFAFVATAAVGVTASGRLPSPLTVAVAGNHWECGYVARVYYYVLVPGTYSLPHAHHPHSYSTSVDCRTAVSSGAGSA